MVQLVEVDRFQAVAADGSVHTVVVRQGRLGIHTMDGDAVATGPLVYQLLDGRALRQDEAGTLTLADTGEVLRRA